MGRKLSQVYSIEYNLLNCFYLYKLDYDCNSLAIEIIYNTFIIYEIKNMDKKLIVDQTRPLTKN